MELLLYTTADRQSGFRALRKEVLFLLSLILHSNPPYSVPDMGHRRLEALENLTEYDYTLAALDWSSG